MLYYRKQPINQWLLKSESVMLRLKEIADIGFTIGADELYQEPNSVLFQRYCESGS
jgi:hypothetical protein